MTGRDLVSRVRSLNKLFSNDNTVSDRMIMKELKSAASTLIKRETNLRRLWNSPNIFTTVECLEMEQVPLSECCDYQSSCMVSRSKEKIPQISEGIFGLLIQSVFSPGMTKFDYAPIERFVNILRLGVKSTKKYFWIQNERLYTSNPDIERINFTAYFDDDLNVDYLNSCSSTAKRQGGDCINPLDKPFRIPSYLEDALIKMVNDQLLRSYFRHIEDKTPDKKDDSQ